jgi:hypothetical protein
MVKYEDRLGSDFDHREVTLRLGRRSTSPKVTIYDSTITDEVADDRVMLAIYECYMPRIFQPKSIRHGNVGSICKELLDPKYQVTCAQIAFRSGEMLIDVRSRHQMPRTKTIKTEVLKVPPKRGIPLGNMFASLRISEESDSERSSNVTPTSWAEEVKNDEKIRDNDKKTSLSPWASGNTLLCSRPLPHPVSISVTSTCRLT